MNPRLHPSVDRLFEHAAGVLEPGRDLVIAAHVAVCPHCRQGVRFGEDVGGVLLEGLTPAPLADDALARALAAVERPAAPEPSAAKPARPDWIAFPSPALEAAWRRRRWAAPGVWVAPVISGPGRARTYLLRVAAGMSVPRHTHRGVELVTVLKGAFKDRDGFHQPGDFAESDASIEHRPMVTDDDECVCLVSTDAPLVARDWIGKLFQPFVRI